MQNVQFQLVSNLQNWEVVSGIRWQDFKTCFSDFSTKVKGLLNEKEEYELNTIIFEKLEFSCFVRMHCYILLKPHFLFFF